MVGDLPEWAASSTSSELVLANPKNFARPPGITRAQAFPLSLRPSTMASERIELDLFRFGFY